MNSILRHSTGILLVFGISLLSATSSIALSAQVLSDPHTGNGAHLSQTLGLHQAALAVSPLQEQTARLLLLGMVMILAALFLYCVYIIRMQREPHSRWQRFTRWLQTRMDLHLPN